MSKALATGLGQRLIKTKEWPIKRAAILLFFKRGVYSAVLTPQV